MRGRYQRRTAARPGSSGHSMFGGTGWLFADLLLALALTFLLAAAVTPPTHKTAARPRPPATATPRPKPKPTVTPKAKPPLDLNYVDVPNVSINAAAILNGDQAALAPVISAITRNSKLRGQRAGLVLLFEGDDGGSFQWQKLDAAAWQLLKKSGQVSSLLQVARVRDFENVGLPSSDFELQFYLFSQP